MPCFHPLRAYKSLERGESGKHGVTFNPHKALIGGSSFKVGCGQCSGCRIDKAGEWSTRCMHEAQMHDRSAFLTLTYDDQNVPASYSVEKAALKLFHMRVQEYFGPGKRYFSCGEYGDEGGRPHYHVLLFGEDFSADREFWCKRDGLPVWRSARLELLWPFGHCEIGSLTAASAGYVARYCLKKFTGQRADEHYFRLSAIDGAMHRVEPEFALMSRRPGIGSTWFDRFKSDVFPWSSVIVDGSPRAVPAYYRNKLTDDERKRLKLDRLRKDARDLSARRRRLANETPERLRVREVVQASRVALLKRSL